jgi:A/G-specific adenine glycosylase
VKQSDTEVFVRAVWAYYNDHGRHELPWRKPEPSGMFDPYKILVSEIMLQQTQVARVIPKYLIFLKTFPTIESLAHAELGAVLRIWQGLGYNRRAKFLLLAAQEIVNAYKGEFPRNEKELVGLPGIGKNTAGAIMAYAFNEPVAYIETNIRSVFIHHFFHDSSDVDDQDILEFVKRTLPADKTMTRDWYWALMDYGVYIKATVGNANTLSKHYVKQSAFHGSKRQLRGTVVRFLHEKPMKIQELQKQIEDARLMEVLDELVAEQMIKRHNDTYSL